MAVDLPIQPLSKHHKRDVFSCGVESLDHYLKAQASQDIRRKVAAVYVQPEEDGKTVVGYYTLSSTSLNVGELPPESAKKLPKYPRVPATLIGRLAVDQRQQGRRLGERLLIDALCRSYETGSRVASAVIVVDAESDAAVSFYKKFGFFSLPDQPRRLFMMMETIGQLYSA